MGVKINGPELEKTATRIDDNADEFEKLCEEIVTQVEKELTEDFSIDGLTWAGNKAGVFKKNVAKLRPDLALAKKNLTNKSADLRGHVNTWTAFEA